MSIHLQREIDKLKRDLLLICSIVEEQVQKAIRALFDRDAELAREVQAMDDDVDRREINLEEECLKTLALHQPVAINLRQLIAALKINNDLERIGDMAVNIARKAAALAAERPSKSRPTSPTWASRPRPCSARASTPWCRWTRRWPATSAPATTRSTS